MTAAPRRRAAALAMLGLAVGVAAVAGYFVVVIRFGSRLPGVRNDPWPIWLAVAAGLALSALAVRRASRGRRIVAGSLLALNLLLAGAFAGMLYVALAVPEADGPPLGLAAPDFTLPDQLGRPVRLDGFRGEPLLLVFYRGHW